MVRDLDIEIVAPQHGSIFRGAEMVARFIDWCEQLQCGVDIICDLFKVPESSPRA
jgi:flavorubredoxin